MMMNLMSALAETTGEVAASGTQTASAGGEMISMIVMLVVMFGVLYFVMIRPQKKKEKALKAA